MEFIGLFIGGSTEVVDDPVDLTEFSTAVLNLVDLKLELNRSHAYFLRHVHVHVPVHL